VYLIPPTQGIFERFTETINVKDGLQKNLFKKDKEEILL